MPVFVLAAALLGDVTPVDADPLGSTAPADIAPGQPPGDPAPAGPATPAPDAPSVPSPAVAGPAPLTYPPELAPQVEFWKRVYSEIDSSHGYIHDAWHMEVIYDTVAIPGNLNRRGLRRFTKNSVHKVSAVLQTLATGKRTQLTGEEADVLAKWPANVSNATLAEAARNVRFQTGQRERFMAGLLRSLPWMPYIDHAIAQYGLPRELAALPHVESSFDMRAYSKVRAAGIWQFMPATARLFMRMDAAVDERYDPVRATEGAAKLLALNYRLIGNWPLAITAYNHGTEGMRRASRTLHTDSLVTIINKYHTRHFGFASRNFYTELMAAWEVSQHTERYFGELPLTPNDSIRYSTVSTDAYFKASVVADALGVNVSVLRAHNPALRPAVWANSLYIPRGFNLRLPERTGISEAALLTRLASIPTRERYAAEPIQLAVATRRKKVRLVVAKHVIAKHNQAVAMQKHSAAASVNGSFPIVDANWEAIESTTSGANPFGPPSLSSSPQQQSGSAMSLSPLAQ